MSNTKTFQAFKIRKTNFIAIPLENTVSIMDDRGNWYGQWFTINGFKKAAGAKSEESSQIGRAFPTTLHGERGLDGSPIMSPCKAELDAVYVLLPSGDNVDCKLKLPPELREACASVTSNGCKIVMWMFGGTAWVVIRNMETGETLCERRLGTHSWPPHENAAVLRAVVEMLSTYSWIN